MKKIFLLGIVALSGACGTKADEKVSPKTAMLTASKWKLTARTMTTTSYGTTTVETAIQPCELDSFDQYNLDKTYAHDEGAVKCGTSLQVLPGTWSFNSDETKLLTVLSTSPTNTIESTIVELTSTKLHIITTSQGRVFTSTSDNAYTAF